jgi:deoxyhypusine synthase
MAIPIFVGAPSDGSVFLNSMKLWALARENGTDYRFDLDLHAEVYESCAYHLWGLRQSEAGALGTLILGGGVPKNFNLQPEPALSQVLGLDDIRGYLYDIQITTAPVTEGSLSSCPPAEAVTWG